MELTSQLLQLIVTTVVTAYNTSVLKKYASLNKNRLSITNNCVPAYNNAILCYQ